MLLKNCRMVSSRGVSRGDILIEGEKIASIGGRLRASEAIDVKGAFVIPGLTDIHVHMRDSEERSKEDFYSGSRAAVAGGVTAFIDMPNSSPPVVDAKVFNLRLAQASQRSIADFGVTLGITGDNWAVEHGIEPAAYKIYMDGTLGEVSDGVIEGTLRLHRDVAVHAERPGLFRGSERPPEAEEEAVRVVSSIAARLKKNVRICHVSSRGSLKHANPYTTWEVTPHHLLLTEEDLEEWGGVAKTNPPLRSWRDVKALWEGVRAGKITIIASDHAPHRARDKDKAMEDAPPGLPNLDVMLRLLLTAVSRRRITLPELVGLMCENPARLLGLESKGRLSPGMDADIVVLDMAGKGRVSVDEFFSKARYSPFEGRRVVGSVDKVFLRGKLVYEEGEITAKKGYGKPLVKATP